MSGASSPPIRLKRGRLPRAIGTDDTQRTAFIDRHADFVGDNDRTERLREPIDLQKHARKGVGGNGCFGLRSGNGLHVGRDRNLWCSPVVGYRQIVLSIADVPPLTTHERCLGDVLGRKRGDSLSIPANIADDRVEVC